MARKKKKIKRGRAKILVSILIIILLALLFFNFRGNNIKLAKNQKTLVVGQKNLFAVYDNKLAVKIPFELNINNEETIQDLVNTKNFENLLKKINNIMPEKLNKYIVLNYDSIKFDVKNKKNIPETNIEDKRIILTSALYSMFDENYGKSSNTVELNENILVDVLNANGIGGYARKTGELLRKKLGVKYNAANYETKLEESYVILNDISNKKALEIIEELPEKYFKIKSKATVPTLANLVVVLGKEKKINFKIQIHCDENNYKVNYRKIKKLGYNNISKITEKIDTDSSFIKYNKEDQFIAQKLSKELNIGSLIETNSLKNQIDIIF